MAASFRFERADEDTWRVVASGRVIGAVYRAWTRLHGHGWSNNLRGSRSTLKSRREAAIDLLRRSIPH